MSPCDSQGHSTASLPVMSWVSSAMVNSLITFLGRLFYSPINHTHFFWLIWDWIAWVFIASDLFPMENSHVVTMHRWKVILPTYCCLLRHLPCGRNRIIFFFTLINYKNILTKAQNIFWETWKDNIGAVQRQGFPLSMACTAWQHLIPVSP